MTPKSLETKLCIWHKVALIEKQMYGTLKDTNYEKCIPCNGYNKKCPDYFYKRNKDNGEEEK